MAEPSPLQLGRRERQIMEAVWRLGQASVVEVREALPDPPSYSAVRAMLRLLEEKGYLRHKEDGRKFVYLPAQAPEKVRRSALRNLLQTFFGGSVTQAVASLIDLEKKGLPQEELDRLAHLIDKAKKEGR